ncbi:MAG: AzlD domain-containing protein [Azospirillum sp.]|nr:AzlD domain-containing protein [Azospirillum sp.]
MSFRPEFLPLLAAMAAAAYFCRVGGFWLMRFVRVTPRVEAALKATPLAVMIGIVLPAALRGGPAEWLALCAIVLTMRFWRNDVAAAMVGVAVVAVSRGFVV